jgi:hypothetical protein
VESSSPKIPAPDRNALDLYYDFPKSSPVSKANFEILYGGAMPENDVAVKGTYTLNTPISEMRESFVGRQFGKLMERQIQTMIGDDHESPTALLLAAIVKEAPLRTLMMFGGGVSREMLDALLMMINGKVFRGLVALIKAVRANKS